MKVTIPREARADPQRAAHQAAISTGTLQATTQLSRLVADSPRLQAQAQLASMIDSSPRMAVQRNRVEQLSGTVSLFQQQAFKNSAPPQNKEAPSQRQAGEKIAGAHSLPAESAVAPPVSGNLAPIQRLLSTGASFTTFVVDVRGRSRSRNSKLDAALRRLYTTAKESKVSIEYDWLVSQAKSAGNSEKRIKTITTGLDASAATERDTDLSGTRGHMMGRHLVVDSEFQENRLRDNPGLERVTRLEPRKFEIQKYQNYVDHLRNNALPEIRQIMRDTAEMIGNRMEDGEFAEAHNNNARRDYLRSFLKTPVEVDTDVFMLSVDITLNVRGNPSTISVKWDPNIESVSPFSKLITERDTRDPSGESFIEFGETDTVEMFWGSSAPQLAGIALGTSADTLLESVDELPLPLGVTQF